MPLPMLQPMLSDSPSALETSSCVSDVQQQLTPQQKQRKHLQQRDQQHEQQLVQQEAQQPQQQAQQQTQQLQQQAQQEEQQLQQQAQQEEQQLQQQAQQEAPQEAPQEVPLFLKPEQLRLPLHRQQPRRQVVPKIRREETHSNHIVIAY